MNKIGIFFISILSRLPMWCLYIFSDIIYFVLFYIVGYRRDVIALNIKKSFPEKSISERKKIVGKFYAHLSDILVEGIKNLTASEEFLLEHFSCSNPELMQELYEKNKSVLLVSGHYNNWEYLISAQDLLFPHKAYGLGTALRNEDWDKYVTEQRERFGMEVIYGRNMVDVYNTGNELSATLMLSDQSPGSADKAYWMEFLNRDTGVRYGVEMLAHQYNMAVVFFHTEKISRGRYQMNLELITENPRETAYGEITEAHTKRLEEVISCNPQYWLWSHKRWKKTKPENYSELFEEYKKRFEDRVYQK